MPLAVAPAPDPIFEALGLRPEPTVATWGAGGGSFATPSAGLWPPAAWCVYAQAAAAAAAAAAATAAALGHHPFGPGFPLPGPAGGPLLLLPEVLPAEPGPAVAAAPLFAAGAGAAAALPPVAGACGAPGAPAAPEPAPVLGGAGVAPPQEAGRSQTSTPPGLGASRHGRGGDGGCGGGGGCQRGQRPAEVLLPRVLFPGAASEERTSPLQGSPQEVGGPGQLATVLLALRECGFPTADAASQQDFALSTPPPKSKFRADAPAFVPGCGVVEDGVAAAAATPPPAMRTDGKGRGHHCPPAARDNFVDVRAKMLRFRNPPFEEPNAAHRLTAAATRPFNEVPIISADVETSDHSTTGEPEEVAAKAKGLGKGAMRSRIRADAAAARATTSSTGRAGVALGGSFTPNAFVTTYDSFHGGPLRWALQSAGLGTASGHLFSPAAPSPWFSTSPPPSLHDAFFVRTVARAKARAKAHCRGYSVGSASVNQRSRKHGAGHHVKDPL